MNTTSNESVVNAVSQEDGKKALNSEGIQELINSVSYGDLHRLLTELLTNRGIKAPAKNLHVLLNVAEHPEQNLQDYAMKSNVELPKKYEIKQTDENDETNMELAVEPSDLVINAEKQYGYPAVFFNHLCEPVRALYVRMNGKSPYPDKPWQPVTKNLIYNLPLTVFRVMYYMANEDNILKFNPNKENKYPFIKVEKSISDLLANIFLKMTTSDYFNILAPLYVFSLIPICVSSSITRFNTYYPLNGINCDELSSTVFRNRVKQLKKIAIEYAKRGHQEIQQVGEEFASDDTTEQSNKSQESQQVEQSNN